MIFLFIKDHKRNLVLTPNDTKQLGGKLVQILKKQRNISIV